MYLGGGSNNSSGGSNDLLGMVGRAAGAMFGIGSERRANKRDRANAERQYENQRRLNQQGADLQMDMWNKTNYGAQLAHMKDAGLNPALMYGMGGGGGATTGSQGGGSASKANAQKQMGIEGAMAAAQIELMKAQGEKTNAEKDAILGDTPESKGRITKLGEEAKEIGQRIENLMESKKNIKAERNLTVTKTEREEILKDTDQINKEFYIDKDLAPGDFGIIKGLKRLGVDAKDAIKWLLSSSDAEKREILGKFFVKSDDMGGN